MQKYLMIVFSNPVEGKEAEYNDWYNNTHLKELLDFSGFKAAQRYTIVPEISGPNAPSQRYLAAYEIETNDINKAIGDFRAIAAAGKLSNSDSVSPETLSSSIFVAVCDRQESAD